MSEKNDTTTNDQEMIVSLLAYLDGQCRPGYRNLVKALVAERDALKQRVAELEAQPADRDLSAKIDKLSSSVSILTCRVAALESAKFVGPHVPVNPWNPYPTTPWIIYGTRTSDKIGESA